MVNMINEIIIVGFTFLIASIILFIAILSLYIVIKIFITKDGKW